MKQRNQSLSAPAYHQALSLEEKLSLLAGAAKYDASCSSSGSTRQGEGIGAAQRSGICHSWSADGRCISLLKVLFSNDCLLDCAYCASRRSNDHQRASFSPEELAGLTIDFYRRNYIEGLFLSSAVCASPDNTMEQLIRTLKLLRYQYRFHGYIHLKVIPGCSPELLAQSASLADRMSANVELPSRESLMLLAPEKQERKILQVFDQAHYYALRRREESSSSKNSPVNAGMSTQMIIGATAENDHTILQKSDALYRLPQLKRVYYSAYIPVNSDSRLPTPAALPPLLREHRLYQADWLLRFYAFRVDEILPATQQQLDPELDPKTAWALRQLEHFPVDINRASKEELLRIPGVGVRSVKRILAARRYQRLQLEDLKKLGVVMKRARYFIHDGKHAGSNTPLREDSLRNALLPAASRQLSFNFTPVPDDSTTAINGEL